MYAISNATTSDSVTDVNVAASSATSTATTTTEVATSTPKKGDSSSKNKNQKKNFRITGYNLFEGQTDDTPCIGASGKNLCTVPYKTAACPSYMPFGTKVKISDQVYVCEDRLAVKYDSRIDINCKFDAKCPYQVTGTYSVEIL